MNTTIILVAGGSGSRMAAAQPKQFLPVHGKAILHHTIEAFHRFDPPFNTLSYCRKSTSISGKIIQR
jgi:2-C-methyl-D-erythritol 4-phosphate cytidylyltransferase